MPTSPNADVVPVRKATKRRLAALKGSRTYDDVIRDMLGGRAPAPPDSRPAARARDPDEQVALARLAATRWRLAVERGDIVEWGPRLVTWNVPEGQASGIRYIWTEGRRGLA